VAIAETEDEEASLEVVEAEAIVVYGVASEEDQVVIAAEDVAGVEALRAPIRNAAALQLVQNHSAEDVEVGTVNFAAVVEGGTFEVAVGEVTSEAEAATFVVVAEVVEAGHPPLALQVSTQRTNLLRSTRVC
jgi:hypothetical protein